MEHSTVAKLISDNLKNLFAFSMSRLYDKTEAEDLTNDIVCEILKSVHRLKNDDAFYGFMWSIAKNTFKTHIRKSEM
ncbi:MAG: sigma-70 family RNA polymerase sigma factor, partial [Clostridia bacterium]